MALAATTSAPPPALAQALLSERLERRDLSKPVFNKAKPGPTRYPPWLEGTWRCTATFAGFEFPSKTMSKNALIKEPTIPGFQKLSLAYVPDVGTPEIVYDVRFAKFEGIEGVLEDRAFNLKSIVNAYLGKDAVSSVEYEPTRDANRTTVNIKPGASPNAERIELFANARESETRRTDGTFFASEASRQVTLGYGRDFGTARVVNTDYQHVWTFTPVFSEGGAEGGAVEGAEGCRERGCQSERGESDAVDGWIRSGQRRLPLYRGAQRARRRADAEPGRSRGRRVRARGALQPHHDAATGVTERMI